MLLHNHRSVPICAIADLEAHASALEERVVELEREKDEAGETREELIDAVELLNRMVDGMTDANRELREQLDDMTIRALQAERHLREDEAYIASLEAGGAPAPAVYGWRRTDPTPDQLAQMLADMEAGRGPWADEAEDSPALFG